MTNTSPRIYAACLASYNAGKLHGTWIDADQDADAIQAEIATMLRESPCPNVLVGCLECDGIGSTLDGTGSNTRVACQACKGTGKVPSAEEWTIHDHEGFEGISIGEHESIEDVAKHARLLSEHDGAWAAYVGLVGAHYATEDGFSDAYQGEFDSDEAYAEQLISDCYDLKSMGNLANYIDYEKFARDLGFDGYSFVPGGSGVYVFSNA